MHHDKRRVVGGAAVLQCRGRDLRDCRGPGSPIVDEVEAAVLDAIDAEVGRVTLDLDAARSVRAARKSQARTDAGRLRREMVKIEEALSRAAVDFARRDMTREEYQGAAALLREDLERLRAQLAEVERVRQAPRSEGVVKLGRALRRRWPVMTAEEKNRALRVVVRQVRVRRAVSYRQPVAERVEVLFL